jgi:hypothetical protein
MKEKAVRHRLDVKDVIVMLQKNMHLKIQKKEKKLV